MTAIGAGDSARAGRLTHDFQTRALAAIETTLAAIADDGKSRQKLVSQLGGERVLDALLEIASIFRIRGTLMELASRLPAEINNLANGELDFDARALRAPRAPAAGLFRLCRWFSCSPA